MTEQPITQAQDHDRRIGQLEGIAEQLDRRLDAIEKRLDRLEQALSAQFRWLVGIQLTTLIALGSLLFGILSKLPD